MSSSTLIAIILAVLILVVIPVTVALYRSWKVPKAWNALQKKRDLDDETPDAEQTESPQHLAGDIRGREVDIWMDTDIAAGGKSGPPHAHYTNVEVPLYTDDHSRVGIKRAGVGTTIWRTVISSPGGYRYKADEMNEGGEPNIGDAGFDEQFAVAGQLSEPLRQALGSAPIVDVLDELLSSTAELHIENGKLRYTEPGRVSRQGRLKKLVDNIVEAAIRLDEMLDGHSQQ